MIGSVVSRNDGGPSKEWLDAAANNAKATKSDRQCDVCGPKGGAQYPWSKRATRTHVQAGMARQAGMC